MSRGRKARDGGEQAAPSVEGPDWRERHDRLLADLEAARMGLADANRLLAEVKAQRNAAMDEIMLLRAQLKVAVEDGKAGWAAAGGATIQTG